MSQLCEQFHVKILAFGTLAGGFLSQRWLDKPEPKMDESLTWSQMKYKRFIDEAGGWAKFQSLLAVLDGVAKKHGVSISNVASKYILTLQAVGGVIIGARLGQSEHVKDNLELFGFELSESEKTSATSLLLSLG